MGGWPRAHGKGETRKWHPESLTSQRITEIPGDNHREDEEEKNERVVLHDLRVEEKPNSKKSKRNGSGGSAGTMHKLQAGRAQRRTIKDRRSSANSTHVRGTRAGEREHAGGKGQS